MSDIKLFRTNNGQVLELAGQSVAIEKSLQSLMESHLEAFLGVRFLSSEQVTGNTHGGRIDTLGVDENGCPVIIEYKRSVNENVINQGLFYLDWLLDHKADFTLLVLKRFGQQVSEEIEWSAPRLVCIAGEFTRYDVHAVQQINRNMELIRYRRYGDELLLLELVNTRTAEMGQDSISHVERTAKGPCKTVSEYLAQASQDMVDQFEALKAFLLALGDDVQMNALKHYIAFKRIKNFVCVEVHPQSVKLSVYVKVNPDTISLEPGFTRDVRKVGHLGTGDLEITIGSVADVERAKPLLLKSYEAN